MKKSVLFVIATGLLTSVPYMSDINSLTGIYCICLNFATAWITYECFRNIWADCNIGFLCSALYTLSIHRICTLTVNGALREGSALTLLPLILYGLYRILVLSEKKPSLHILSCLSLAMGYTGLMMLHIPTYEITVFVTIFLCIFCFHRKNIWQIVLVVLLHLVSACGALFLLRDYCSAQIAEIRQLAGEAIQHNGLYVTHLLFYFWNPQRITSIEGLDFEYSRITGFGLMLAAAVAIFLILWFSGVFSGTLIEKPVQIRFAKVSAVLSVLLMFMSLNIFPWDHLQTLNRFTAVSIGSLQYPGCCLGWGTALAVNVCGCCLRHLKNYSRKYYKVFYVLTAAGAAASGIYLIGCAAAWRLR